MKNIVPENFSHSLPPGSGATGLSAQCGNPYLYRMPDLRTSIFPAAKEMIFSISLVFFNITVFFLSWFLAGTTGGHKWTSTLLLLGAQFNPLTLDREGYRIISHLFLHGSIVHLIGTQYLLLYLGYSLERRVGSGKFALIFFLTGVGAAISGLYWNLFSVNVGSSGAISGLLGFSLVLNIFFGGKSWKPMLILLAHFAAFTAVNFFFFKQMYADYAGMFGGVIMGIAVGFISFARGRREHIGKVKLEYLMVPVLLLLFVLMPGHQVRYFKFFKQVVAAEDTTRHLIKEKLTDDDMRTFMRNYHHWEEIQARLHKQHGLPGDLAPDTFKLARYIHLRKQENLLKKMVVQREAYAYLDSVERLQEVMRQYMDLEYGLWSRIQAANAKPDLEANMVKVSYDSSGNEATEGNAAFYRKGVKDSLGRWDGPFREYDAADRIRVKGVYKKNKRDGVFLYYSEKGVCMEAGRYLNNRKFGKWQTFYSNGRIHSETFYNSGYFVSAVWDSLGTQVVVDGNGRETQVYPDDVVKEVGDYRHGLKEGIWYGRYANGEMRYEETFNQGTLVAGKSRTPDGETFIYDESSLYPMPEGGFEKFGEYLKAETKKVNSEDLGHVKLSFRISSTGALSDITIDQSATPRLDAMAKEILRKGPRWLPARKHGYEPVAGWGFVQVEFY